MLIRTGLRSHFPQTLLKREFALLFDQDCLTTIASSQINVLQLIIDIGLINPPIKIILLTQENKELREPLFEAIPPSVNPTPFSPANLSDDDSRKRLLDSDDSAKAMRTLCALAKHLNVDGIVTSSSDLVKARHALYQHDLIKIIPSDEFADFVEICAHGLGVFWSASNETPFIHDIYYNLANHKCQKLANWWNTFQEKVPSKEAQKQLRSLILNRYPFILYSRDMVRFFQLQKDHLTRLGHANRFSLPLSYHVNMFYFFLWGMLDQLCLVANYVFDLGVHQRNCGISGKEFLKALDKNKPNLRKFLRATKVMDWIETMSDFRHTIAHQVIPMPTLLVTETEESKKSREEILKIIETEEPYLYAILTFPMPQEVKTNIEDQMVFLWRAKKMKTIADHVVFLEGKKGSYWRSPVISVDYDLAMLTAIMDAFLIGMFGKH